VPDDANSGMDIPKLTPSGFFMHVAAYFLCSLLGLLAFHNVTLKILFLVFAHGLLIEGIQYFIPYRSFNPLDIMANMSGILAAFFVMALYHFRNK
jgi:VanZ family protein